MLMARSSSMNSSQTVKASPSPRTTRKSTSASTSTGVSCEVSRPNSWLCKKASTRSSPSTCSSLLTRRSWRYGTSVCSYVQLKFKPAEMICLFVADCVRPGENRHQRLEVQHASQTLHSGQQHCEVVLESCGVLRWGAQGPAAAVCHRLFKSSSARF